MRWMIVRNIDRQIQDVRQIGINEDKDLDEYL